MKVKSGMGQGPHAPKRKKVNTKEGHPKDKMLRARQDFVTAVSWPLGGPCQLTALSCK